MVKIVTITDLLVVWDLCRRAIVGLLEEDLFHLAVLQVVQLSHSIFGALDQVNKHRLRPFALDKCMLHTTRGGYDDEDKEQML